MLCVLITINYNLKKIQGSYRTKSEIKLIYIFKFVNFRVRLNPSEPIEKKRRLIAFHIQKQHRKTALQFSQVIGYEYLTKKVDM